MAISAQYHPRERHRVGWFLCTPRKDHMAALYLILIMVTEKKCMPSAWLVIISFASNSLRGVFSCRARFPCVTADATKFMGLTWAAPGSYGPHVGPRNLAILLCTLGNKMCWMINSKMKFPNLLWCVITKFKYFNDLHNLTKVRSTSFLYYNSQHVFIYGKTKCDMIWNVSLFLSS